MQTIGSLDCVDVLRLSINNDYKLSIACDVLLSFYVCVFT